MRKLFLLLLLMVASNSAMAEWVGIGRAKDGTGKFFANPRTIEKSGGNAKVWVLTDFKQTQILKNGIKPFRSYSLRLEVDCKHGKTRNISFIVYSGNMGKGETVLSDDHESGWDTTAQGSILQVISEYACRKR